MLATTEATYPLLLPASFCSTAVASELGLVRWIKYFVWNKELVSGEEGHNLFHQAKKTCFPPAFYSPKSMIMAHYSFPSLCCANKGTFSFRKLGVWQVYEI